MKIDESADFGTRECPSCAAEVEANNNRCPCCGYEFPQLGPARQGLRLWGSLALALLIVALLLAGSLSY